MNKDLGKMWQQRIAVSFGTRPAAQVPMSIESRKIGSPKKQANVRAA